MRAKIEKAGYRLGKAVLKNLDVSVEQGEVVMIAGPSGSGKTTFFLASTGVLTNLLQGWVEGSVSLGGVDPLSPNGFDEIPRLVGVVLQDPEKQVAMPTPYDEVAFTLENLGFEDVEERTRKMLGGVGLSGKEFESVENLSGGEKRRLTIAAAIAHDPGYLLLDEPTASLDPWAISSVRGFIAEMKKRGKHVLVIEHKARYFLDLADRIVVVRDGSIAYESPGTRVDIALLEKLGVDAGEPNIREGRGVCRETVASVHKLVAGYKGGYTIEVPEFKACKGEVVAVVGPNGSGKTTLLKTLARLLKPVEGRVSVRGRSFYVPQVPDYVFVAPTLEREIAEARAKGGGDPERLLSKFAWYRGLRTASPYSLSHGQRRIVGLAVALAYRPQLTLLDEPTTGLDREAYESVRAAILELSLDSAVVVATHDVRLVGDVADRVYMVQDGVLSEVDKQRAVGAMEEAWKSWG
ncbi:ABC transporter ATP-binding protein [Aeropyrum pernix]|uniref:ABC transporter ATP-binding protein n=1 Tax=Aeropyrum pernix TaxID=56636 RepID=UPI0013F15F8F|nr:ABC transporter ATP-binding protein [Aeropyrum pernix]